MNNMKLTLEEEARNVLKEKEKVGYSYEYYDGFIAGANSKWVQAEKIKLLIEYLTEAYNKKHNILNTIIELEQQLKQLEDEQR
jgi:hypothetical protein